MWRECCPWFPLGCPKRVKGAKLRLSLDRSRLEPSSHSYYAPATDSGGGSADQLDEFTEILRNRCEGFVTFVGFTCQ